MTMSTINLKILDPALRPTEYGIIGPLGRSVTVISLSRSMTPSSSNTYFEDGSYTEGEEGQVDEGHLGGQK